MRYVVQNFHLMLIWSADDNADFDPETDNDN